MATFPYPAIVKTKDEFLRPGLFSVVHYTSVTVADKIGQLIPSIMIEYLVVSVTKPVPVKVTTYPP